MRILLVDDHAIVREGVRAALRRAFPTVQIIDAGSGPEAMQKYRLMRPHLALVDINLPGMNGLELIRHLRAHDSGAKIIVLPAEADPHAVRTALDLGALGFLLKTNAHRLLPEAIRAGMKGERYLCEDSAAALKLAGEAGPASAEPPGLWVLSEREREVLKWIALGKSTKATAVDLGVSPKTIESHRKHIMAKLKLDNVADLTRYAIRHGLIPM